MFAGGLAMMLWGWCGSSLHIYSSASRSLEPGKEGVHQIVYLDFDINILEGSGVFDLLSTCKHLREQILHYIDTLGQILRCTLRIWEILVSWQSW